ncbi:MAG: mandelate racemase/muconate lactonizing enzyme family protein [Opitutaceae bacterium]|nr:mandelate racemase/muconate lactonizing enzyme family protein [Opitutaceae bacterium]
MSTPRRFSSLPRRAFLRNSAALALLGATRAAASAAPSGRIVPSAEELKRIMDAPVLNLEFVKSPVTVASLELLQNGRNYLVRARSTDGVEAITVPNPAIMTKAYPVLLGSVINTFLKQDARKLEQLHWDVYRGGSNYKMQGQLYWVSVMAVEQALLELMGQTTKRPVADFFGGSKRRDVPVYYASGNRGNTPEAEIEYLQKLVAGSGVKAIKFRLGGRMNHNADSLPGRTEKLIPLVRKTFGDGMTLYADSNSSYDVKEAIRIGRIMEAHRFGFYEEPCEFDDLWSTKAVADALTIPIAGGEQEYSLHRWHWMVANRGVDIVQPDLHYGGGFIRATKVARMAAAAGMTVVPHMSGGGLGYLDVVQFASFTPNIGPFQEFKGNVTIPVSCPTSSLKCENGMVRCPTGPGFGVTVDPDFVKKAHVVKLG